MKEVKDFANAIRSSVEALKKTTQAAQSELMTEISRGNTNAQKVRSMTAELKEANKEVESFLGETGSNFPPSETSVTPPPAGPVTDINGVTITPKGTGQ